MTVGLLFFLCALSVGLAWQHASAAAESPIDSVTMLIPNIWAMPGDTINLPVFMLEDVTGSAIFSVQLDFTFDPDIVSLAGDSVLTEGTISDEWSTLFVYNHIDTNTLRMVWASIDSLRGNGPFVFITLRIHTTTSLGETGPLFLEICSINEGYPACKAIDGTLTIGQPPRIEISESTHDYGLVSIGDSIDWVLGISNVGDNVLDIYQLAADNTQFEPVSPLFPQSITSSEIMDAVIAFKPLSDDTSRGTLRIFCNDLDNLVVDILLKGTGQGTNVQLSSFSAQRQGKDVMLEWSTSQETDHLGFYLYRSCHSDRGFQRIHSELISGYLRYTFCDKTASESCMYYYKLNAVDGSGREETVGYTVMKGFQSVPTHFSLSQNFPNPFNPITYITFEIAEEEHATLIVYNTLGRVIDTLFEGVAKPGYYSVSWDGSDASGNTLPTGVYFYRLQTSKVDISKRMLLLR